MNRQNDKIFIETFVVGPLAENCYLLADNRTKDACLIDPGAEAAKIKKVIDKNNFNLKFIINTHGHGDHIGANKDFNVPIYIHSGDKDFLADPRKNLSPLIMLSIKSPEASRILKDGDVIDLGGLSIKVLHTPGHTPGSISLLVDKIVFTGDTLFNGSIGRTDFVYGDSDAIMRSISNKLMDLDDDVVIYPGHGEPSTIGDERRSNPFLTED